MKRSEMINKIIDLIEGEHSWDGPKCRISLEYAMGIALNILEMQEKEGMLPPPYLKLRDYNVIKYRSYSNTWEPEDNE